MNKLEDILRLVLTTSLSDRAIGHHAAVSKNTVRRHRQVCLAEGYLWDVLRALPPDELERRFNKKIAQQTHRRLPDFGYIHSELARPGVSLQLLWEEYRTSDPVDALSYSQFTFHYRQYQSSLKLSMRQIHHPGEKAFVDYSGKRPRYVNIETGELVTVELFVGVLGYSNLTFALATKTQNVLDWIEVNVQMLEYFGGAPTIIVPDNLKAAVIRPGSQPILNKNYQKFARHYDVAIIPARKRHPKDKATVEGGVRIVQRWILARLRNQRFTSLEALNAEIRTLCGELNLRLMKRLNCSRRERFDAHERATLTPLPSNRYELAQWYASQTVGPDYHVCIERHWYSVPYQLIRARLECRATLRTVEIFHRGNRIASHVVGAEGGTTTDPKHQHPQHRAYAQRTPENMLAWASNIGPSLLLVVSAQLERKVPALGLPVCSSLRNLAQQYGPAELEQACARAVALQSLTYKSVKSLLSTGRYKATHPDEFTQGELPLHHNLRGATYYQDEGGSSC